MIVDPVVTDSNIEHVIRLAEFRLELRNQRLTRRWQMMLAIWAVLVGAIAKSAQFHPTLLVGLAVGALAGAIWWIMEDWRRERLDVDIMHGWQDAAARHLSPSFNYHRKPRRFYEHADNAFQVMVTFALSVALVFIVLSGPSKGNAEAETKTAAANPPAAAPAMPPVK